MIEWRDMSNAPRDGSWILAMNNRGNCAVIIWSGEALSDRGDGRLYRGWIHPFSDGRLSTFWNGANGSLPVLWSPLPHGAELERLIGDRAERDRLTRIESEIMRAHYAQQAENA